MGIHENSCCEKKAEKKKPKHAPPSCVMWGYPSRSIGPQKCVCQKNQEKLKSKLHPKQKPSSSHKKKNKSKTHKKQRGEKTPRDDTTTKKKEERRLRPKKTRHHNPKKEAEKSVNGVVKIAIKIRIGIKIAIAI